MAAAPIKFPELPFDIHFEVASHLDYRTVMALTETSRYFHNHIDPRKCLPEDQQEEFLGIADQRKHNVAVWACFTCYRMLPIDAFGDRMRKLKTGTHGAQLTRNRTRFCVECAIKHKLYDHLVPTRKGKLLYYLCHQCGRFQTKSNKCQQVFIPEDGEMKKVTVCWDGPAAPRELTPFEALPTNIHKKLARYLGYSDILRLSQVSRHMLESVKPAASVPLHERFFFVRQKWLADVQSLWPNQAMSVYDTLPCYACFRIRPKNRFTERQLLNSGTHNRENYWKRRCNACISRLYRTPDNADLREFRLRRMCGTCGLLRYKNRPCEGCLDMVAKGELKAVPPEEHPAMDYTQFLGGVTELFPETVEDDAMSEETVRPPRSSTPVSDDEYERLEKLQRRFWRGELTTAERSLYARIESRIHNRWERQEGAMGRVGSFFRRCQCLAHRAFTSAPTTAGGS
jgi:hypothetical protein